MKIPNVIRQLYVFKPYKSIYLNIKTKNQEEFKGALDSNILFCLGSKVRLVAIFEWHEQWNRKKVKCITIFFIVILILLIFFSDLINTNTCCF